MKRYVATLIREGTFRGVSPPKPIRFSRRVLAQAFASMEGKPLKLQHAGVPALVAGAPVGRVERVRLSHDAIVGELVLDAASPHFELAKSFLDSTLALGGTPNVSIEGGFDAKERDGVLDVESIQFTALAVVPRGACSDLAGCGVSAALMGESKMMNDTTTNTASDAVATDASASNAATTGVVTFTVVNDAEPAKPCPCKGEAAQLAAVDAEKNALAAKLADAEAKVAQLGAQIADEKAKLPLLVELAALVPEIDGAALSLGELRATLNGAKLAAAKPAALSAERKTLLAEPAPKQKTHMDLLRERMSLA